MTQSLLALAFVAAAAAWLAVRGWRTFARRGGCAGCACAALARSSKK